MRMMGIMIIGTLRTTISNCLPPDILLELVHGDSGITAKTLGDFKRELFADYVTTELFLDPTCTTRFLKVADCVNGFILSKGVIQIFPDR